MDPVKTDGTFERLMRRRNEVEMTLRHLEKERKEVDGNTDWIDRTVYRSRVELLHDLTNWYLKEIARIEKALCRHRLRERDDKI